MRQLAPADTAQVPLRCASCSAKDLPRLHASAFDAMRLTPVASLSAPASRRYASATPALGDQPKPPNSRHAATPPSPRIPKPIYPESSSQSAPLACDAEPEPPEKLTTPSHVLALLNRSEALPCSASRQGGVPCSGNSLARRVDMTPRTGARSRLASTPVPRASPCDAHDGLNGPAEAELPLPHPAARLPSSRAPDSIRPARDDVDERTLIIHSAPERDRVAADLAVLHVTERARRHIHRGVERLTAVRTLHHHQFRQVRYVRAARLEHRL